MTSGPLTNNADELGEFGAGSDSESSVEHCSDPSDRSKAIQEAKKPLPTQTSTAMTTQKKTEFELP
jgi:hypothetical protein